MPRSSESGPNLPPEKYRLYSTETDDLIDTPLDGRGLVDLDKLITTIKSTVVPEYNWTSKLNDVHHLQWFQSLYHQHPHPELAIEFRGLVNRMVYVPRVFHNWIHRITIPPPVPEIDVMHHSIEAQRVAISLFETASQAMHLTRSREIGERALKLRLESAFEHYNIYLDNAREVPREFSLVKIEQLEASSIDEMLSANRILGRMALNRIHRYSWQVKNTA